MPSSYAHYRFGATALEDIPADIRRPILRYRQLFDIGVHGPDLFFYQNPLGKSTGTTYARKLHRQTGRDFFTRVCKRLRLEPSEAGSAYLYGVLAHYCLDSVCHGFVDACVEAEQVGHVELETEFDRFLLVTDGKLPPHTQDCSKHMKLSKADCAVAADFYAPTPAATVQQCVRNMAISTKLLSVSDGPVRKALEKALLLTGGSLPEFLMTEEENPRCAHLNSQLLALYEEAMALFPIMGEQIYAHTTYGAPLGEEFNRTFNG